MVDIYLKEFNKKFKVMASNKNMRATYKLQLTMAKASQLEGKSPIEQVESVLDMTTQMQSYLVDVLKLTKQQQQHLDEEIDNQVTTELANHVAMRLMGVSEEDIAKSKKEMEVDAEKKA